MQNRDENTFLRNMKFVDGNLNQNPFDTLNLNLSINYNKFRENFGPD